MSKFDSKSQMMVKLDELSIMHVPKGKVFKIGKLFYLYYDESMFWFRIFNGYGFTGKNWKKNKPLFSERNGYVKYLKIGSWKFKFLKPNKI